MGCVSHCTFIKLYCICHHYISHPPWSRHWHRPLKHLGHFFMYKYFVSGLNLMFSLSQLACPFLCSASLKQTSRCPLHFFAVMHVLGGQHVPTYFSISCRSSRSPTWHLHAHISVMKSLVCSQKCRLRNRADRTWCCASVDVVLKYCYSCQGSLSLFWEWHPSEQPSPAKLSALEGSQNSH